MEHTLERIKISVYASLIAIILATFYNLMRIGLEFHLIESLKTLGFIFFILNFPIQLIFKLKRSNESGIIGDESWWIAILLVLSCILGLVGIEAAYFFMLGGLLCFLANLIAFFKGGSRRELISFVFILFLGIWFSLNVWDGDYVHPLLLEKLATDDRIHIDTIFHVSIAQMIKTYLIPSTGLSGLPFYHYHFGSHFMFAGLSKTLGIGVFTFYQLSYPIIFIPLFFKALLGLPIVWNKKFRPVPYKFDLAFWIVVSAGFVGVFPLFRVLSKAALEVSPLFASESYCVSLLFVFLLINIILHQYQFNEQDKTYHLGWPVWVTSMTLIFMVGLTKNSTLFLLDIVLLYLFFRLRLYNQKMAWLQYLGIGVISFACLFITVDMKAGDGSFAPFDFYKNHVELSFVPFVVVYFFWSILLIGICFFLLKFDTKHSGGTIDYTRVLLEIVILICIVGAIPGMLFAIAGGSAGFFMNFQMWFSLAFLLVILPRGKEVIQQVVQDIRATSTKRAAILFLILVSGYVIFIPLYNFRKSARVYVKHMMEDRQVMCGELADPNGTLSLAENFKNISRINPDVKRCLAVNPQYQVLSHLLELDTTSIQEKTQSRLLLADIRIVSQKYPCYMYFFFFPALTGFAVENGFVFDDCHGRNYSFEYYRREDVKASFLKKDYNEFIVNLDSTRVTVSRP